MKKIIALCLLGFFMANSQINDTFTKSDFIFSINKDAKIEDENGHLVTDSIKRAVFFGKKLDYVKALYESEALSTRSLTPVPLCSNGNIEEFENIGSETVLKDFKYAIGDPLNPMQCKNISANANFGIKIFNPSENNLMVRTVPSNHIDEFIGNINAFDQYAVQINYKNSSPSLGLVQAKRFKTDNESFVKFNYKAVLQSVDGDAHYDEQPYFKVRVVNQSGQMVNEFCLIADVENCIFKQAPYLEGGSIILYTPNWQAGYIDISAIPNNETFTLEFMASRCGLNGHFGYAYLDDICLLHSDETIQGSIELDPLHAICPTFPMNICGSFTIPNSGTVVANINSIVLTIKDASGQVVYTTQTTSSLNLATKRFCFTINQANLPNVTNGSYNVGVVINYGIDQTTSCTGTNFNAAFDDDANTGWDIWFLNCTNCNLNVQTASLFKCDTNNDYKEIFDLTQAQSLIVSNQTGLTFSYFTNLTDATNNTNPINTPANHESFSVNVFVRITLNATCYKIIPIKLVVRNPRAYISGVLNVCYGSTELTASSGTSYLWSTGETTQNITVTNVGNYSVTVTDINGCSAIGQVTILPSTIAPQPTIEVTQPDCFSPYGAINITSPASEFSFDGGATWSTNPQVSNLNVGTYAVQIKTINNCFSYVVDINIVPFFSTFPVCSTIQPNFCGDTGTITIISPADLYSFDDGLTWITSNTVSNLAPGTYLIRTKDVNGCISNSNSITLFSDFLPIPDVIYDNPYCGNLGQIIITTPAAFYSFDGGTTWQTSNTLSNLTSGSYIIKIKNDIGCESPTEYVYLENLENTYPLYEIDPAGCGKYATLTITTHGDEYSFDSGITWTTNPVLTNLDFGDNFYIIVKKFPSCLSLSNYVSIYSTYYPLPVTNNYEDYLCDDLNDNVENIDLTIYNSSLINNHLNFSFKYFRTLNGAENDLFSDEILNFLNFDINFNNPIVYVRVISQDNCYKVAELKFNQILSPVINNINDGFICKGSSVILYAEQIFDSYLWSTGSTNYGVALVTPGNYWLTVTKNHNTPTGLRICESTKHFTLTLSEKAIIQNIITFDWTENQNVIEVYVEGVGNYVFSLDGINYQSSPIFTNLEPGNYQVYIKDLNGCENILSKDIFLLHYPKFFTPNGDGYNDTWRIKYSEHEPNLKVTIFDRHGKVVKELKSKDAGWDGRYNGEPLFSNDYWFVVSRENGRIHKGHFSLKR